LRLPILIGREMSPSTGLNALASAVSIEPSSTDLDALLSSPKLRDLEIYDSYNETITSCSRKTYDSLFEVDQE
jgi:hypothetical protein